MAPPVQLLSPGGTEPPAHHHLFLYPFLDPHQPTGPRAPSVMRSVHPIHSDFEDEVVKSGQALIARGTGPEAVSALYALHGCVTGTVRPGGKFLSPRKVPEGGGWRPSEDRLLHGTVAPHHPDTSVSSPGGPGSLSLHGCHEDEQSSSTPFRALLLLEGTGCRSAWGAMGQQPAASPPTPAPPLLPGP